MIASRAPEASQPTNSNSEPSRAANFVPIIVLAAGFLVRLIPAARLFLNPDEALHNLLASQPTFARAWDAALTNAHPPLLILLLYYWRSLGQSELWLRLPSILAGTAASWLIYEWLKLVSNRSTAFTGLLLFCFAPSLILLSAEIRQYALLLFFIVACLYLAEGALREKSSARMALFSLSLYGALLTHYSALIFALAIGICLLVRLYPYRDRSLVAAWGVGQIGGIAIAAYFLTTHIPRLRQTGMVRADLESYLRRSTFHPGERNPAGFLASQTVRVFTYIFSHGLIGSLMFLAFLAGIVWLLWPKRLSGEIPSSAPSTRQIALLLSLPFVLSWVVALAGLYPLGATRHDAFLAPFAVAGASLGITAIPVRAWRKWIAVLLCLAVCNFFPAPPPLLREQDQSQSLMHDAIDYLRQSAPPGSVLLTDYESGLLLGFYACGHGVVQVFPPLQSFARADCGGYTVLATSFRDWKFTADTFPGELAAAAKALPAGTEMWFFYAGWINDSAPALKAQLGQFGCAAPKNFGRDILVCRVTVK